MLSRAVRHVVTTQGLLRPRGGRGGGWVRAGVRELHWTATLRTRFIAPPSKVYSVRWVWSGTGRGVSKWVWLKGTLVCGGVVVCRQLVGGAVRVVECRSGGGRRKGDRVLPSRLIHHGRSHDQELEFDWSKFWEFILPELLLFSLAVAVSRNYMYMY